MKRLLTILVLACLSCCSLPASAISQSSNGNNTERRKCGVTGLFRVLTVRQTKVILLQRGCFVYREGKIVNFESGEDEILAPNADRRYVPSFSERGAYFYFQKGRPHLSYLYGGERHRVLLARLKGRDDVFTYSQFLRALKSH